MGNTLITSDIITKEALRILHQKATFIGSVYRGDEKHFAKKGNKIGDTLSIRRPNQYTVSSGKTLDVQNVVESSIDLKVETQKHVDMKFDSADLTLDIDLFSERYIQPAMSALAANIEADALSMYKDVYQVSDQDGTAFTNLSVIYGSQILTEGLAPLDMRTALLSPASSAKFKSSVDAFFNPTKEISKMYKEGIVGRTSGFDIGESTLILPHTTGTAAKSTGYTVNGATQSGAAITIQTGSTTFLVGDVVTFAGCYRVHPETKANTGVLQQFVVTANSGASATSLAISPSLTISGAGQNVSGYPTDSGAVVKVAAGANETMQGNIAYHKDAFTFATANLAMPSGVDFASRQVLDGISIRIIRDYDINNDNMPCRLDVLYGYKTVRPELAVRIHADG